MRGLKSYVSRILLSLIMAWSIISCTPEGYDIEKAGKNIFILYSIGYNNLTGYLSEDISEAISNFRPTSPNDILITYSHMAKRRGDYTTPTNPILTQIGLNENGRVKADTLMIYPDNTNSASASTLHEVLDFIKGKYPEAHYGILFSSHSTGWVPQDYCNDPGEYDSAAENNYEFEWMSMRRAGARPALTWGVEMPDGSPVVKSFGSQTISSSSKAYEMDITDMALAIPMKMDYIIFDSCLMGGIEVAYEFRKVCRYMIFSQTEILANGMDYSRITSHTFFRNEPAMKQICQDYYNQYAKEKGMDKSATISLIDCSKLEDLAHICRQIFESQREEIAANEGSNEIQKYFRSGEYSYYHKWFYDLESIVNHSDTPKSMLLTFYEALDKCVRYKAATEKFMSDIVINEHCGLSMYLPYAEYDYLNSFYRTLEWNKATNLVQ